MARNLKSLFPTVITTGSLSKGVALNRRLLKDIKDFSSRDRMGKDWSRENFVGGYTSYASLSDLHYRSPAFSELAEALQPEAEAFAKAQGWETRGLNLEMSTCWMNLMPKGTYHTSHLHPHSVISGTYYVSVPPGSAGLKIEDPRMGFFMNAPLRKKQGLYHHVKPKAGSFVMFESWLRHEVPPNQSKQPRISVSFNYSLEAQDL